MTWLPAVCLLGHPSLSMHSSSEPDLLAKASLITRVGNWEEGQVSVGNYCWWSPTQILAITAEDGERSIDIRTGAVTPTKAPTLRLGGRFNLSPNRKMVVQRDWVGTKVTWRITDPAGDKQLGSWSDVSHSPRPARSEMTGDFGPDTTWSVDSRSIYQIESWSDNLGQQVQVVERDVSDLNRVHAFPKVFTKEDWGAFYTVHDGRVLVTQVNRPDKKFYPIKEWSLPDPQSTLKRWTVRAPVGKIIVDYLPSPDSTKALWVMGKPGLHTLGDGYPYRAISLWVSGLHGESMREIGAIDFGTDDQTAQMNHYQHLGGLDWNPDGRAVSFIYYRKLYTVKTAP